MIGSWTRRIFERLANTIGGTGAITTQPFVELNVKRGRQFFITEVVDSVPDTGNNFKEYLFRTGSDPLILKQRIIKTNSDNVDYEVSVGGTLNFTDDGTAITVRNANTVTPNATQVQIFEDPTYTGSGDLVEVDWVPGATGFFGSSEGSFSTEGFEKIIPANSELLVRFTNNGSNPTKLFYFLTWYEGEISSLGGE